MIKILRLFWAASGNGTSDGVRAGSHILNLYRLKKEIN